MERRFEIVFNFKGYVFNDFIVLFLSRSGKLFFRMKKSYIGGYRREDLRGMFGFCREFL